MSKTPEERKQAAISAAQELGIDRIVRTIARESERSKGDDCNRTAVFDGKTFIGSDAGTLTARVETTQGVVLYEATDRGRFINVFRNGPWVARATLEADRIRRLMEAERAAKDMKQAEEMDASFAPYQD